MKLLRFALIPVVLFLLPGFATPLFAQWEPDRRLTYNDSTSNTSFNNAWCIAAKGSIVHVAWYDKRDGNWEIYYKQSTDNGVTWLPDVRLTEDTSASEYPSLAAAGSFVHVVWMDNRDGNWEIYYKRSTDYGASWPFPDVRLTNDTSSSQYPSLAVSGSVIHVVWQDTRKGKYDAFYKRSTDGGLTWRNDTCLSIPSDTVRRPSVAVADSGVHVTWLGKMNSQQQIYYKRSTDAGMSWPFHDTALTNVPNGTGLLHPSIAASDSLVYIAWGWNAADYSFPRTKRSTNVGRSWEPETLLSNIHLVTAFGEPSIAAKGLDASVVWAAIFVPYPDWGTLTYYNGTSDGGAHWAPDTLINAITSTLPGGLPSIALADLAIHVVSRDGRDGNYEIYYQRDLLGPSGREVLSTSLTPSIEQRLAASPNPFTSFATVPGHFSERFALYDIAGRRVGTYKGERIGMDLRPGVYFIRALEGETRLGRIVKVR